MKEKAENKLLSEVCNIYTGNSINEQEKKQKYKTRLFAY